MLGKAEEKGFEAEPQPAKTVSKGMKADCISGTIKVKVPKCRQQDSTQLSIKTPESHFDVVKIFFRYMFKYADLINDGSQVDEAHEDATYDIHTTFCVPISGSKDKRSGEEAWKTKPIQLLVHDVGFTGASYWDFDAEYSWVDRAAEKGFPTLYFDKMGTGKSQQPTNAMTEVQAKTQVLILERIAEMLKAGDIASTKFPKVIGVGHGYGSSLLVAATHVAVYTDLFDALVLTGWDAKPYTAGTQLLFTNLKIAKLSNAIGFSQQLDQNKAPKSREDIVPISKSKFKDLPMSYLVLADEGANTWLNFAGDFDPQVVRKLEDQKAPIPMGELLTLSNLTQVAENWSGPIFYAIGETDVIFAGGLVNTDEKRNMLPTAFPSDQMLWNDPHMYKSETLPGVGHAINLHKDGPRVIKLINGWLAEEMCGEKSCIS